jgi:hypothetical protein
VHRHARPVRPRRSNPSATRSPAMPAATVPTSCRAARIW